MPYCPMCGMDVVLSGEGRCALGHTVAGAGTTGVQGVLPDSPAAPLEQVTEAPIVEAVATLPVAEVVTTPPDAEDVTVPRPPMIEIIPAVSPRRPSRLIAGVLAVVLVAGAATAYLTLGPGGTRADAATYRRVFAAGDTRSYALSMEVRGNTEVGSMTQSMNMHVGMVLTERTASIDAEGIATIRVSVSQLAAALDGKPVPMPGGDQLSFVMRVAPDGRVVGTEGFEGLGLDSAGPLDSFVDPGSLNLNFPLGKIAPGNSWTTQEVEKLFGDTIRVVTRNRLTKLGTDRGRPTATIHSELDAPMHMRLTGEQLRQMAAETGSLSSGSVPANSTLTFDGRMALKSDSTVLRDTCDAIEMIARGTMDFTMKIEGTSSQELRMRFTLDMAMSELTAGAAI